MRAIKEAGGKKEYWNALPTLPRVTLIREPMDRAFSAYRMFWTQGSTDASFEDYLNALLNKRRIDDIPPSDMHIQTQWASMGKKKPDILIKWDFEQLSETLGLTFPHDGEGVDLGFPQISDATNSLFNEYYKEDYELWK